jgi:hypothetical protein
MPGVLGYTALKLIACHHLLQPDSSPLDQEIDKKGISI